MPRHHSIHLLLEFPQARTLAVAGMLGVGEAQLHDGAASRLDGQLQLGTGACSEFPSVLKSERNGARSELRDCAQWSSQ